MTKSEIEKIIYACVDFKVSTGELIGTEKAATKIMSLAKAMFEKFAEYNFKNGYVILTADDKTHYWQELDKINILEPGKTTGQLFNEWQKTLK